MKILALDLGKFKTPSKLTNKGTGAIHLRRKSLAIRFAGVSDRQAAPTKAPAGKRYHVKTKNSGPATCKPGTS